MMDIDRYKVFYDKLTFVTLQMPNFTKEEHELESNFDKWLYVIKNLHKLDHIPERIQERVFQKLFKVASYTALSKEEKSKYDDSLKYYNDLKNSLDTAQQEGYQEGYQEAQTVYEAQLGQEKQRAEQEKQRAEQEKQRAEQAEQKLYASIQRMREAGFADAYICKFLNMSIEELERRMKQE